MACVDLITFRTFGRSAKAALNSLAAELEPATVASTDIIRFKAHPRHSKLKRTSIFSSAHFLIIKAAMLPWPYRFYFWAVHGVFAEVVFTALWEFVVSGNLRLMGVSSVWSFLVYGLGTFLMAEPVRSFLLWKRVPLLARCLCYVAFTYLWEFTCGIVLDHFQARPWDYSEFSYNVMGLITMEYIPVWFFGGLCFEGIMAAMEKVEPIPKWAPIKED